MLLPTCSAGNAVFLILNRLDFCNIKTTWKGCTLRAWNVVNKFKVNYHYQNIPLSLVCLSYVKAFF